MPGRAKPLSLLIVEDNPGDARLIKAYLAESKDLPFSFHKAASLKEALQAIKENEFSAVLLDLSLPDSSGGETFEAIKEAVGGVPVLVLTGSDDERFAASLILSGAQDYLFKREINGPLLRRAIRYAIERNRTDVAMQTSEQRYRQLVEASPDIIFIHCDGLIVYINQTGIDLLGAQSSEQIIGRQIADFIHYDYFQTVMEQSRYVVDHNEKSQAVQEIMVRLDGSFIDVEMVGLPFSIQGKPAVQMIARDIGAKKRTEEQLSRLAAIVEGTDDAIIGIDLKGIIQSWNRGAEKLYGYSSKEIVGKELNVIVPPDLQEEFTGIMEKLAQGESVRDLETYRISKDAKRIHVSLTISPTKDSNGKLIGASAIARNITAQKQRELDLKASEERFRQMAENIKEIFFIIEAEKKTIEYVSPAYEEVTGYPCKDLYADPLEWTGFTHPDDKERLLDVYQNSLESLNEEYRIIRKDGGIRWLRTRAFPVKDASGVTRRIVGIAEDITDRKLAEQKTREQEEQLRAFVNAMPDLLFVLDEEGRYIQALTSNENLFYSESQKLIGHLMHDVLPKEAADLYLSTVRKTVETGKTQVLEYSLEVPAGTRHFEGRTSPLNKMLNGKRMVVWVSRDITERKEAEEALRRSQQQLLQAQKIDAIGRLAGGVAHDFNNNLSVILGCVSFIQDSPDLPTQTLEDLMEIKKAAERSAELTKQLLAFSRRQLLEPRVINLNTVIADMEKMLRRLIGENIELATFYDAALGQIKADPGQIQQVIINLVVNGRDALQSGGRLAIETMNVDIAKKGAHIEKYPLSVGPYVRIVVKDNGCGMSSEMVSHIFEPFFTTKETGKGTGLGLSMVYGIVKQSGGYIFVDSTPSKGTEFRIYFPRIEEAAKPVSCPIPAQTAAKATETVLLVEDENDVRGVTRRMLEECGYTVLEAANAGEAFLLCEEMKSHIHLLLTDIVMPHMNGSQMADRLSALHPEMKVVFMSGYTDPGLISETELSKAGAYLAKPITKETLIRKVRDVLDHRNAA